MKHYYLISLILTLTTSLYAQLDTTFQHTETVKEVFENQQMVDAKRYLLNSLMDEKHIFRLGFEGISLPSSEKIGFHFPLANSLFLEYEHRIKTGFSINTRLNYIRATPFTIHQAILNSVDYPIVHQYGFHIESRWYFKKQQQLNNKESGNNLNGIYTSLLAGFRQVQFPSLILIDGSQPLLRSQYRYSTLNLGWQRRFAGNGEHY